MYILIVDDEPLVRKSLGRACRARGHEVAEAVDGTEGLHKWLTQTPDIVFLDVLMPGLSGPELLAAVIAQKGMLAPSKVILISAYSGEHNLAKSRPEVATPAQANSGGMQPAPAGDSFDLFIPKPFADVFEVVRKAEVLFGG